MFQKLSLLWDSKRLPWLIIGYGIILRLVQYLHNRSLEIDEARDTVVGILGRAFSDLFKLPDIYIPTPAVGFFIIEKIAVHFFGDSEYALRLFPLLAGIISLFLFYFVAKQYVKQKVVLIALILFATLEPLIYYSAAVRPYSGDIVMALTMLYLTLSYIHSERLTISQTALFGGIGAVMIWFSTTSVFMLGGVGISLFLLSLIKKEWTRVGNLLFIYSIWALSFSVYYFFYLHNFSGNPFMYNAAKGEDMFMPFPPSFSTIKWFIARFFGTFEETVGFFQPGIAGIAALAFIIGCVSIFRDKKENFFCLISPAVLVLFASCISLYPFRQRLIIFLVPSLLFFIAEGTEYVMNKTANNARIIGIAFIVLLLFHPLLSSANHLIKPITTEEIKPVLSYIKKNWQNGDVLYVHYGAHPALTYYSKKYGFKESDYIVGVYAGDRNNQWEFSVDYLRAYTKDLDKLRGKKRIWILFTHTPMLNKGIDEEVFFIYYLNTIGKQIDSFRDIEASVYLYDLSSVMVDSRKDSDVRKPPHWNF